MEKKLDINFRPYIILGACNPQFAYKALQSEDKIGTMLPCNVVVQEVGKDQVEVSAVSVSWRSVSACRVSVASRPAGDAVTPLAPPQDYSEKRRRMPSSRSATT